MELILHNDTYIKSLQKEEKSFISGEPYIHVSPGIYSPSKGLFLLRKPYQKNEWQFNKSNLLNFTKGKNLVCKKVAIVTDDWSGNYFHWLSDVLQRIIVLKKLGFDGEVLIPSKLMELDYVKSTLSRFDGCQFRYVQEFQNILSYNYILPILNSPSGVYQKNIVKEISWKLLSNKVIDTQSENKILIIRRDPAKKRMILNEEKTITALNAFGIKAVCFDNLPWIEQQKMMCSTSMMIGVHGAGLTNMIFMATGSTIIELRREDDHSNNCYMNLACALGHKYYYLKCEVDNKLVTTQQNNFHVDVEQLKSMVETIIVNNSSLQV